MKGDRGQGGLEKTRGDDEKERERMFVYVSCARASERARWQECKRIERERGRAREAGGARSILTANPVVSYRLPYS